MTYSLREVQGAKSADRQADPPQDPHELHAARPRRSRGLRAQSVPGIEGVAVAPDPATRVCAVTATRPGRKATRRRRTRRPATWVVDPAPRSRWAVVLHRAQPGTPGQGLPSSPAPEATQPVRAVVRPSARGRRRGALSATHCPRRFTGVVTERSRWPAAPFEPSDELREAEDRDFWFSLRFGAPFVACAGVAIAGDALGTRLDSAWLSTVAEAATLLAVPAWVWGAWRLTQVRRRYFALQRQERRAWKEAHGKPPE
jgi:hypothetical protein